MSTADYVRLGLPPISGAPGLQQLSIRARRGCVEPVPESRTITDHVAAPGRIPGQGVGREEPPCFTVLVQHRQ